MNLIQKLEQIPFQGRRVERKYRLDQDILLAIRDISLQYMCSEESVVETLLRFAVAQTWAFMDYSWLWENLSRREKEIVALSCLDYTNREIASRLGISSETVKTHLYNAMGKLQIKGRKNLARALANWDFSDWNR